MLRFLICTPAMQVQHFVLPCNFRDRHAAVRFLINSRQAERVLVFTRTKAEVRVRAYAGRLVC